MYYTNSEILEIVKKNVKVPMSINHDHIYRTSEKIQDSKKTNKISKNGTIVKGVKLDDFVSALIDSNIFSGNQEYVVEAIKKFQDDEVPNNQQKINFEVEKPIENISALPSINFNNAEPIQLISGVKKNGSFYIVIHGTSLEDVKDFVKIPESVISDFKNISNKNDVASVISFAIQNVKNIAGIF